MGTMQNARASGVARLRLGVNLPKTPGLERPEREWARATYADKLVTLLGGVLPALAAYDAYSQVVNRYAPSPVPETVPASESEPVAKFQAAHAEAFEAAFPGGGPSAEDGNVTLAGAQFFFGGELYAIRFTRGNYMLMDRKKAIGLWPIPRSSSGTLDFEAAVIEAQSRLEARQSSKGSQVRVP
jgi:hypothetical protein